MLKQFKIILWLIAFNEYVVDKCFVYLFNLFQEFVGYE